MDVGRAMVVGVDDDAEPVNREYSWHDINNLSSLGLFFNPIRMCNGSA